MDKSQERLLYALGLGFNFAYITYVEFFSYDQYRDGSFNKIQVKYNSNFKVRLKVIMNNCATKTIALNEKRKVDDKIREFLEQLMRCQSLHDIVVTKAQKDAEQLANAKKGIKPKSSKQIKAGWLIEEMRGYPNAIRWKFGPYRVIFLRSDNYDTLIFADIFRRVDGYSKALKRLKGLLGDKGYLQSLGITPPTKKQLVEFKEQADKADARVQENENF